VDGHGNFGSLDNDPPAAMRYTECRLHRLAMASLLTDLEADTVQFAPNFDGSQVGPHSPPFAHISDIILHIVACKLAHTSFSVFLVCKRRSK
jgi:DNA gyrase subunit A